MAPPKIFIGTSGWNYDHWKRAFYPAGMPTDEWLAYYAKTFGSVEVNKSFYRLIPERTYRHWKEITPPKFLFAEKGSRFLTHLKKLKDTGRGLRRFFDPLKGLGRKKGPVLFQLPPYWKKNVERLEEFLKKVPAGAQTVWEFRDPSWFSSEVYETLRRHHAGFCIYDFNARTSSPKEITASPVYLRF